MNAYFKDVSKYPVLTKEQEKELFHVWHNGDKKAFHKIINSNLRFVISVAKEFDVKGFELRDLINEGNLGLIAAAHKFDPALDFKFISYAVWWIRNAINRARHDKSRTIRHQANAKTEIDVVSFDSLKHDVADERVNFYSEIEQKSLKKYILKKISKTLDLRERKIVLMYFGFSTGKAQTLENIATELNLTKERIRQIKAKALKILLKSFKNEEW